MYRCVDAKMVYDGVSSRLTGLFCLKSAIPPPSPIVIFLAASDPMHTAVHCWRLCISAG